MHLNRITDARHPLYNRALELYRASFPFHEQRETASQAAILSDPAYHFELIYDGDVFVGLLLYWEAEDFLYIEHFCILPELRNRQYGRRALEQLRAQPKTLLLEIDPPEDGISLRRRGFYERCGFLENGFPHVHPPYHRDCEGHRLVVMTCPERIPPEQYARFLRFLRERVMAGAFPRE